MHKTKYIRIAASFVIDVSLTLCVMTLCYLSYIFQLVYELSNVLLFLLILYGICFLHLQPSTRRTWITNIRYHHQ